MSFDTLTLTGKECISLPIEQNFRIWLHLPPESPIPLHTLATLLGRLLGRVDEFSLPVKPYCHNCDSPH